MEEKATWVESVKKKDKRKSQTTTENRIGISKKRREEKSSRTNKKKKEKKTGFEPTGPARGQRAEKTVKNPSLNGRTRKAVGPGKKKTKDCRDTKKGGGGDNRKEKEGCFRNRKLIRRPGRGGGEKPTRGEGQRGKNPKNSTPTDKNTRGECQTKEQSVLGGQVVSKNTKK